MQGTRASTTDLLPKDAYAADSIRPAVNRRKDSTSFKISEVIPEANRRQL